MKGAFLIPYSLGILHILDCSLEPISSISSSIEVLFIIVWIVQYIYNLHDAKPDVMLSCFVLKDVIRK